eukprot:SAG31_NODE_25716_length_456_cov_0.565826_1_plen_58_part_10
MPNHLNLDGETHSNRLLNRSKKLNQFKDALAASDHALPPDSAAQLDSLLSALAAGTAN